MNLHLKRRLDIYLNGTDGAKELAIGMLSAWRHLLPASGLFGVAMVEFITAIARVAFVIVLPLLFWIAPVIALFTAHHAMTDEEVRHRMRDGIHKNGGAS